MDALTLRQYWSTSLTANQIRRTLREHYCFPPEKMPRKGQEPLSWAFDGGCIRVSRDAACRKPMYVFSLHRWEPVVSAEQEAPGYSGA